ncbi:MAG: rod shape-determining protein MreC [Flammeovirgaceae bacterium]
MRNLIKFISLYNYSITFYLLVFFSSYFLINDNFVLKTKYFNSSNYIIGSVFTFQNSIKNYFTLKEKNLLLEVENKQLKQELINTSNDFSNDSIDNYQFSLIEAEVINNSLRKTKNYITINKGIKHGVKEGMGVISNSGIIGKVKYVSDNFSTVISLLNTSFFVSSLIKESGTLSSVNWEGKDPSKLKLLYVPKHLDIVEGSDVVSSSFDSIYPKGILIGKIISVNREVNSNFYDIDISSSQNFYSISKVYVINNFMYEEKKSLEKITDEE